jgi:hypothetical protein
VGIAPTPDGDGDGYWLADSGGEVRTLGDAGYYGSMAGARLNQPIVHIVSTADGRGYWLVAPDRGTFAFGDAHFYGSMAELPLNAPIVDIATTGGYWLVASDGGVFAFDAPFLGSGALALHDSHRAMVITSSLCCAISVRVSAGCSQAGTLRGLHASIRAC